MTNISSQAGESPTVKNVHDSLFKTIFKNPRNASPVLRTALPARLVRYLDFRTLRVQEGSYIDEELRSKFSDVLFSIRAGGQPARLYLLYEHQSEPDVLMAFRMLKYMAAIWARYVDEHPKARSLPPIIPVVLHHGEGGWTVPTCVQDLYEVPGHMEDVFAPYMPRFSFILDDLARQSTEDLRRRTALPIPAITLWLYRHGRSPAFQDSERVIQAMYQDIDDLLRQAVNTPHARPALERLISYTLYVTAVEPRALGKALSQRIDRRFSEMVMTTAERLIQEGIELGREEGREEGIELGREEGIELGRRGILHKLLMLKFGPLPADAVARIEAADMAALDRFIELVLTASELDDVFVTR